MAQLVAKRSGLKRSQNRAAAATILRRLIKKYPILTGTKIKWTTDTKGYQAICYYQSKLIVVNPFHAAPIKRIIEHECGHIIDWHDNRKINWGENLGHIKS